MCSSTSFLLSFRAHEPAVALFSKATQQLANCGAIGNASAVRDAADGRAGRAVPADGVAVHAAAGAPGGIPTPRYPHPRSATATTQDGGVARAAPPRPRDSFAATGLRRRDRGPRSAARGRRPTVQRTPALFH